MRFYGFESIPHSLPTPFENEKDANSGTLDLVPIIDDINENTQYGLDRFITELQKNKLDEVLDLFKENFEAKETLNEEIEYAEEENSESEDPIIRVRRPSNFDLVEKEIQR